MCCAPPESSTTSCRSGISSKGPISAVEPTKTAHDTRWRASMRQIRLVDMAIAATAIRGAISAASPASMV
jgi:hypothetical protein